MLCQKEEREKRWSREEHCKYVTICSVAMRILGNRVEGVLVAKQAAVLCALLSCWVCEACLHSSVCLRKRGPFSQAYRGVQWKPAQCGGKLAPVQWKTNRYNYRRKCCSACS